MSIRERKPGVFEVMVYGTVRPDGTRPRKHRTVHGGIRAARRAEREMLAERDAGRLETKSPTVSAFINWWMQDKQSGLAQSTQGKNEYLASYVKRLIGERRLTSINTIALREFRSMLGETGLSGATQRMVWYFLSQTLNQATREGFVPGNLCHCVRPPENDAVESDHLNPEQVAELLKAIECKPRLHLIASFLLATGARPSEALAVTWEDTDLEAGTVLLRATKTKTKAGTRTIPLSTHMVDALHDHRASQVSQRLQCGDRWTGNLVFPSTLGRPWTYNALRIAWNKAGAGEHCTLYALRHTTITRWLQAGMRPALVSQLAGHSQQTVTLNTYSHVDTSELEDARRIVDAM